jgi:hypothetical protein
MWLPIIDVDSFHRSDFNLVIQNNNVKKLPKNVNFTTRVIGTNKKEII